VALLLMVSTSSSNTAGCWPDVASVLIETGDASSASHLTSHEPREEYSLQRGRKRWQGFSKKQGRSGC